jgi:hypothetical protein
VGIDSSPLAVEVAREVGVRDAHVCRLEELDDRFGTFDTVAMYGNNFGLFGSERQARRLLRRLLRLTTGRSRIIASSLDIGATDNPLHLAYYARNARRGRMRGQARLRVRHGAETTPWFDYLFVSPDEMSALAESAGWRLAHTFSGDDPRYVGILERHDV